MKRLALLTALLLTPMAPLQAQTYQFAPNQARAIDGDTLRIGDQRIRLSAIDAPELSQTCLGAMGGLYLCGRDSRSALAALIADGVRCSVEAIDRYRREVARCETADGRDIGAAMVAQGQAIAYLKYDGRRYAADQARASKAKAGMHAGSFIEPEQWRRGIR